MRPEYEKILSDAKSSVEYWSQTAILDFTEEIARLMDEEKINRTELARRLESSPAYVTKVLRGDVNFTLATMTKLAMALNAVVRVHLSPNGVVVKWHHELVSRDIGAVAESDHIDSEVCEFAFNSVGSDENHTVAVATNG